MPPLLTPLRTRIHLAVASNLSLISMPTAPPTVAVPQAPAPTTAPDPPSARCTTNLRRAAITDPPPPTPLPSPRPLCTSPAAPCPAAPSSGPSPPVTIPPSYAPSSSCTSWPSNPPSSVAADWRRGAPQSRGGRAAPPRDRPVAPWSQGACRRHPRRNPRARPAPCGSHAAPPRGGPCTQLEPRSWADSPAPRRLGARTLTGLRG